MFENKTPRCPVATFKFFITKRLTEIKNNDPFYLAIIHNPTTDVCFKKSPMGANTVNNIMKNMKLNSPLHNSTKNLTNHSFCTKNCCQKAKTSLGTT